MNEKEVGEWLLTDRDLDNAGDVNGAELVPSPLLTIGD